MVVSFLLIAAGYAILYMSGDVFKSVSGNDDASLQLRKAIRHLNRDLVASYYPEVLIEQVPGARGVVGDAVCMLSCSAGDDARGPVSLTESGAPFWQRNVLFYIALPQGDTCTGGPDADGYEDMCPHKVLIRKVIDSDPATLPLPDGNPTSDEEVLLTSLSLYLTRPTARLGTGAMLSEPGVTYAEVVAADLLTMRVEREPEPDAPTEILVTLRAFNELAGQKNTNIGSALLTNHPKTRTQLLSTFPRNDQ